MNTICRQYKSRWFRLLFSHAREFINSRQISDCTKIGTFYFINIADCKKRLDCQILEQDYIKAQNPAFQFINK